MPVGEQYEACRTILAHQVKKTIPLKVLLYPLHKLIPDNGGKMKIHRNIRDVSDNLGFRCQILWNRLQRIRWDTDSLIGDLCNCHCIPLTTYRRIKDFGELITKFVGVLLKAMAGWTVSVRRGEDLEEERMTKAIKTMETQSPS